MEEPSLERLRHTAWLARLGLEEQELLSLAPQVEAILAEFAVLGTVDTSGVPPTGGPGDLRDVLRRDEPRPSGLDEALLEQTPDRQGRHHGVPRTLGGHP